MSVALTPSTPLVRPCIAGFVFVAAALIATFTRGGAHAVAVDQEEAVVGPLVDGILEGTCVREGEHVEAGQVVAIIVSEQVRKDEQHLLALTCATLACTLDREAARIRLRAAGLTDDDLEDLARTGPTGRVRLRAPVAGRVRLHAVPVGSAVPWRTDVLRIEPVVNSR